MGCAAVVYALRRWETLTSGDGGGRSGAEGGGGAVEPPAIFDAGAVGRMLPMAACIDEMATAMVALSSGVAVQPVRQVVKLPLEGNKFGIIAGMPCFSVIGGQPYCGMKSITVFPSNKPPMYAHQGSVLLFEADSGCLLSISDAHEITAIRTAAASAVATRLLATKEASVLCLLGTGVQAVKHAAAICCVRGITRCNVWGRTQARAEAVAEAVTELLGIAAVACVSAEEAVRGADVICTLTGATSPILEYGWVKAGAHVNAVGACTPAHRELDLGLVTKTRLYVDTAAACLKEPGDIVQPMKQGVDVPIIGEIGQLIQGECPGRTGAADITVFKSVGAAVEDLYAANLVRFPPLRGV